MKKILPLCLLALASFAVRAQSPGTPTAGPGNTGGLLWASNFGQWSVPQGNTGQFSWSSPTFCTATAANIPLNPVFAVGTPVTIKDTIPANSETVTPSAVTVGTSGCSITVTPANPHNTFLLQSGTAGLQESINYAHNLPYQVLLTPDWTRLGGTTGMITAAQGSANVSILDMRNSCLIAYTWSGSAYAETADFCTGGGGGSCPDPIAGAGWAQFSDGSACVGEFIDSEITYGNALTIQPSPGDQIVIDPTIGFTRSATTSIYGSDEDNAIDLYADGQINQDAQIIASCGYNGVRTGSSPGHCPNGQTTTQTVYGEFNVTDGEIWTDGGLELYGATGGGFLQFYPQQLNSAGSPYTLTETSPYFEPIDATGGNVVINLPEICVSFDPDCNDGQAFLFTREDASGNTVTINAFTGTSETINGSPSVTLSSQFQVIKLIADYTGNVGGTPAWVITNGGGGGSGLSGMTAGQIPVAATSSTVTSSMPLAGSGDGITTGPLTSVNGNCPEFVGTAGQIGDSGSPCGSGGTITGIDSDGTPVTPSAGVVNFAAGTNITLTPSGNTITITASATAATAFSALTTATNTSADMHVGTGASLDATGTGIVDANEVNAAVVAASAGFLASNSSGQLIAAAYTPAHCTAGTTGSDCLTLTLGLVPTANLGSGSASSATFLRGDQTYATPAGFANPMTTVGDAMYGGASGVATRLAGPTTSGHTFVYAWQPSGSAIAPVALDLATWYATLTINATQVNGATLPASALFGGWNSSRQAVAATAGNLATLLASLTNCTVTGYPYVPADNQCDAPGASLPSVQLTMPTTAIGAGTCTSAQNVTVSGLVAPSGSTPGSTFSVAYEGNPSAVTGWGASAGLSLKLWVSTANTLSWNVCNVSAASISGGALKVDVGAH